MTAKRAANIIVYNWLTGGGTSPWWLTSEDMNFYMANYGYKVTDKRRDEILVHAAKIIDPVRMKLSESLQKDGFDI
ncbi:hypothetical protein D3C74_91750 [compost metagenome]